MRPATASKVARERAVDRACSRLKRWLGMAREIEVAQKEAEAPR